MTPAVRNKEVLGNYQTERDVVSLWAEKAVITIVIWIQKETGFNKMFVVFWERCYCGLGGGSGGDGVSEMVRRWQWKKRSHDLGVRDLPRDALYQVSVCCFYLDLTDAREHPPCGRTKAEVLHVEDRKVTRNQKIECDVLGDNQDWSLRSSSLECKDTGLSVTRADALSDSITS